MSFKFKDEKDNERATPGTGSVSSSHSTGGSTGGKSEAFLGKGSKVVGTLTFTGPVELDGHIEGEVHAKDGLTIGEGAVITGKVTGSEVVVRGTVNGDIVASKWLSLKRPAKVTGNIAAPTLSIEEGVAFEGKCSMGAASDSRSTIKPATPEKTISAV